MKNKKIEQFNLDIIRIRVDLGNEIFTDAEIPRGHLITADTIESLVSKFNEYRLSKNAEIVEINNSEVVLDTADLTILVLFDMDSDRDITSEEIKKFNNLLEGVS